MPILLHQTVRQLGPAETLLGHFQQQQVVRRRPDPPLRFVLAVGIGIEVQLAMAGQVRLGRLLQCCQRVSAGDENAHLRLPGQSAHADVRRVMRLRRQQPQVRAAALQQTQDIPRFSDHAFKLDVLVALLELVHHLIVRSELIHVRENDGQARFDVIGQADAQLVESFAGGKDLLDVPEHLAPGFGQHRVTSLAIEQADAQVGLKVGDRGTDGRLAFTQLARRCREGAKGDGFDKGV
ncbi:hypothetical protein D9M71_384410 [compost metagenome]